MGRSNGLLVAAVSLALGTTVSPVAAQDAPLEGTPPTPVARLSVTVHIADRVAQTSVDQVFRNPGSGQREATWVLPLAPGAAMDRFSMDMNGREVPGEMLDADRARRIYESIVSRRRDPGLMEMAEDGSFRARAFPIPAGGEARVRYGYSQALEAGSGSTTWRFPLHALVACAGSMTDVTFRMEVETSEPMSALYSPTHRVQVEKESDRRAVVTWSSKQTPAARDFVLAVQEPGEGLGMTLLTSRGAGEPEGSFLLLVSPSADRERSTIPRDMVFCIDTSGSMAGKKMEQARGALLYALHTLTPQDRFAIVRFSSEARTFRSTLVDATPDNLEAAVQYVGTLQAAGGTAIDEALRTALPLLEGGDATRHAAVLFMTDGLPTIGEKDPDTILASAVAAAPRHTRTFVFGVGHDVHTVLLDRLADRLHGARDYVDPDEDIEVKVSALVDKTRYPAVTNLHLEVDGVTVSRVAPADLPDLFHGGDLVIAGRYTGSGKGVVRLRGDTAEGPVVMEREVEFPAKTTATEYVDRLWAVRRVGVLLDSMRLEGETEAMRTEAIDLAKRHRIVTRYTSWISREDGEESLGDPRFNSDSPFQGQGTNSSIGVGGSAGGAFGGRTGGHRNLRAEGGGGTEGATEAGLEWLKNHQAPGGFWDADGFGAMCKDVPCDGAGDADADCGTTGLALLTFLGYGETHKTPRYGHVVRNGLRWLKEHQRPDGSFSDDPRQHALAALAMAEAYGLTMSPLFKSSAQSGIDHVLALQEPYGGWRSEADPRTPDTLLTSLMVMALKSAQGAGLRVDPAAFVGALNLIDDSTDPATGRVGHSGDPTTAAASPASLTAAAGMARAFCGADRNDAAMRRAADVCLEDLETRAAGPVDATFVYYGTLLTFQMGGNHWWRWNRAMRPLVIDHQRMDKSDHRFGSWDTGGVVTCDAGRLESTCRQELCLQVYYRYARVFGSRSHPRSPTGKDAVDASRDAKRLREAKSADEGE